MTISCLLVLGRNRNSPGQLVIKISVYCYEIYLRYTFAVFSPLFLLLLIRFEREVGEYTIAVGSSLFNRGPLFLGPIYGAIREKELRSEFLCSFYFFFSTYTLARGHPKLYSATMSRITGRLAGNINIDPSKVWNLNIFSPFYGSQSFLNRMAIAILCIFFANRRLVVRRFKGSHF